MDLIYDICESNLYVCLFTIQISFGLNIDFDYSDYNIFENIWISFGFGLI